MEMRTQSYNCKEQNLPHSHESLDEGPKLQMKPNLTSTFIIALEDPEQGISHTGPGLLTYTIVS